MKAILKREELERACDKIILALQGKWGDPLEKVIKFSALPDTLEVEVDPVECPHPDMTVMLPCSRCGETMIGQQRKIDFLRDELRNKPKKKLLAPALYKDRFGWAITSKLYDETLQMFGVDKVIWPAPFNPQTGFYEIEEE